MSKGWQTLGFLLMVVGLSGCAAAQRAHLRTDAAPAAQRALMSDDQCTQLLGQRDTAQLVGKILTGVGGIGALGAAPESLPEAGRWGIAAGAAGTVAVGLAVLWYGELKGTELERYCATEEVADGR